MGASKPFVEAACICENVLFDKQDVASLIRIVDQFEAAIPENLPKDMPAAFPLILFVRLKSADAKITGKVAVQVKKPDGTLRPKTEIPNNIELEPRRGFQLKMDLTIRDPQDGYYLFEVFWNDEPVTTVSMEVKIKRVTGTTQSQPPH